MYLCWAWMKVPSQVNASTERVATYYAGRLPVSQPQFDPCIVGQFNHSANICLIGWYYDHRVIRSSMRR